MADWWYLDDGDILWGGAGADIFQGYGAGFGSHTIMDYEAADRIQSLGADQSLSAVMGATYVQVIDGGGNVLFILSGITDPSIVSFV